MKTLSNPHIWDNYTKQAIYGILKYRFSNLKGYSTSVNFEKLHETKYCSHMWVNHEKYATYGGVVQKSVITFTGN
jgi:hypothetical protein